MTTIFYDGKNLHADRARLLTCVPSRSLFDTTKLFRSPDNQIAIACCGAIPVAGEERDAVFLLARDILTRMHTGKMRDREYIKDYDCDKYKPARIRSITFIGMSDTHAFRVNEGLISPQTDQPTYGGSGGRYAFAAYYVTHDAVAALECAFRLDRLSGGGIDSIPGDSLAPFTIG